MSSSNDSQDPDKKGVNPEEVGHDEGLYSDEDLQKIHSQLLREKVEPSEKDSPVPIFVIFLFAILFFWGGFYLSTYSGDFRADVFDPEWKGGVKEGAEEVFDPLVKGKKLYARQCQQCHQADGMGLPGVYPPLVNSPWLLTSEERPVKILLKGISGPINVMGKDFNGNMPEISEWKDRDIAAVLTFVRQNWTNKAGPISEELVAKVREEIKDRTKPWTSGELLKAHPL